MKRAILLLAMMAVALVSASGIALAATILGTDKDETLIGTRYADLVVANGGADEVRGNSGPDQLYGNAGRDRIRGGFGEDHLYGGGGDDTIFSEDIFSQSGAYRDVVDCGPGDDFASVDFRDRVRANCELVGVATP
jgi:Ca2+-binding RTX toxin-like protein